MPKAARRVAEKYKDYHTPLADNFQILLPNCFCPKQYDLKTFYYFLEYHRAN